MPEGKSLSDISKSTAAQQPKEGKAAAGDSWKSNGKNDETTKPGENAAANAGDGKVLQEGVGDGS